jgi:SsrA-binding protein
MRIFNKKAGFNYKLEDEKYEAGLVLSGGEAKAIRTGHADLNQSYARILSGNAYLINANIPVVGAKDYDSTRMRRLLLHKSEIISIQSKIKQRKLTLVPMKLYTKGRIIKLGLALGKSKREFEKRETIKKMDFQRDLERELKDS